MSAVAALVAGHTASGGSKSGLGLLFVGIVFVVVGTLNATNPQLQWRMRRWQYKNKEAMEPSAAALTFTRVLGAGFAVLGVVLIVVAITKLS